MNPAVSLIPINRDATAEGYDGELPDLTVEVFSTTAKLYETVGFEEPWIC